MEANTKMLQLTFDKGLTNVPSDAVCDDNSLSEESYGMIYREGEHKVIQKPKKAKDLKGYELLFIHRISSIERYIMRTGDSMVSANSEGVVLQYSLLSINGTVSVTAIGNYLIVNDNDGVKILLYEAGNYIVIPDEIPCPEIECSMVVSGQQVSNDVNITEAGLGFYEGNSSNRRLQVGNQGTWSDWVRGTYASNKNEIAKKGKFWSSFWLIAVLRLKDGTYLKMTPPILMLPNTGRNSVIYRFSRDDNATGSRVRFLTWYSNLTLRLKTDYSRYKSIADKVVIFVTEQVENIDIENIPAPEIFGNGYGFSGISVEGGRMVEHTTNLYLNNDPTNHHSVQSLKSQSYKTLLKEKNIFYKLKEVDIDNQEWVECNESREFLGEATKLTSTYNASFSKIPKSIFAYNGRLFLANIKRKFVDKFYYFRPKDGSEHTYTYLVRIKTYESYSWYKYEVTSSTTQGAYFFFPDNRADHVKIYKDDAYLLLDVDLEQHKTLQGAFYISDHPLQDGTDIQARVDQNISYFDGETLPEQIMTSEVSNPLVFSADGYFSVTGEIIGMTSITTAVSQGQFGQYPLIVFTSRGIYACYISDEGLIKSVSPLSREVCNNTKTIVQTDNSVFFSSDKGLMMIVGEHVDCVSTQLSGKDTNGTFVDFLKDAVVAYDYRDSLLWFFNTNETYLYLYSIKSNTYSKLIISDEPGIYLSRNFGTHLGGVSYSYITDDITVEEGTLEEWREANPMGTGTEGQYIAYSASVGRFL